MTQDILEVFGEIRSLNGEQLRQFQKTIDAADTRCPCCNTVVGPQGKVIKGDAGQIVILCHVAAEAVKEHLGKPFFSRGSVSSMIEMELRSASMFNSRAASILAAIAGRGTNQVNQEKMRDIALSLRAARA